jgi:hypothetical protein
VCAADRRVLLGDAISVRALWPAIGRKWMQTFDRAPARSRVGLSDVSPSGFAAVHLSATERSPQSTPNR